MMREGQQREWHPVKQGWLGWANVAFRATRKEQADKVEDFF
jgi:hypothetical protein